MKDILAPIPMIAIPLLVVAGWITHMSVCIAAKSWAFMIIGGALFPIGAIHGWATWLGYNWSL
jgi:hypothetical protein